MRVLLVDDHEVVRGGLRALIGAHEDLEVVNEAGTVADAIAHARTFEPDVVVMDARLPDGTGVEACREIRSRMPRRACSCSRRSPTTRRCSTRSWPAPRATSSSRCVAPT